MVPALLGPVQPRHADRAGSPDPARSQRYPLQLPVRFRVRPDAEWDTGYTENLSDSGAIIRAKTQLMPADTVEVMIALPSSSGHTGGCLCGQARVVRSFSLVGDDADAAFAVTFTHYRLERAANAPQP